MYGITPNAPITWVANSGPWQLYLILPIRFKKANQEGSDKPNRQIYEGLCAKHDKGRDSPRFWTTCKRPLGMQHLKSAIALFHVLPTGQQCSG